MKLGQFLALWIGALILVSAVIAVIRHFPGHQALFIGTSLTDHAVPETDSDLANALSGRFEKHVFHGVRRPEILRELEWAKTNRRPVVFVEVTHFLLELARVSDADGSQAAGWQAEGWQPMRQYGNDLLVDVRLIGLRASAFVGAQKSIARDNIDRAYRVRHNRIKSFFPIRPGATREYADLVSAIADLRAAGTEIILIAPPFSQLAHDLSGPGAFDQVATLARGLSQETGAPLFMPHPPWPNMLYIDSSHLNRAGREKFRRQLLDWLQTTRSGSFDS